MSFSLRSPIAVSALILVGSAVFSRSAQATLSDPYFAATAFNNYYTGSSSGMFGADAMANSSGYLWSSNAWSKGDLYSGGPDETDSDLAQYVYFDGAYYTSLNFDTTMDFSFTVDTDSVLNWDYTQASGYMDSILTIDGTSVDVTSLLFSQSGFDVSGSVLLAPGSHDVELDATAYNFGSQIYDQNSLHLGIISPSINSSSPGPVAWAPMFASGLAACFRRRKRTAGPLQPN